MHCSINYSLNLKNLGFTLIELLVTITIASILLMLSVPSIQGLFIKNNIRRVTDDFTQSVFKARNTAVSKNICTIMCMSSTITAKAPSCDTKNKNDWQAGWIVFLNPSCDSTKNAPEDFEDILEIRGGVGDEYFLKNQSSVTKLSFNSRGMNGLSGAAQFDTQYKEISDKNNEKYVVSICLDALGRTRTIPFGKECKTYN